MQPADKSRYYLKAAAIGGAVGGVLSALPFVNVCNCVCCLWILGAGFLAAYLLQTWSNQSVTAGEGASVGVLAGLIAGVVESVVFLALLPTQRLQMAARLERLPPEMRPVMDDLMASGTFSVIIVVTSLVTGAIFGTLGGLLGAAILGRRD